LAVTANSTLDFGLGTTNTVQFSTLIAGTVTALSGGTLTLTISGWTGNAYNLSDTLDSGFATQDHFNIGTTSLFTANTIIPGVIFDGFGAGMQVQNGAQFEIVPVPEPTSMALLGSVGLCALLGYRGRRRSSTRKSG
jgi:hypothetical protein